jgi:hypothetical protein
MRRGTRPDWTEEARQEIEGGRSSEDVAAEHGVSARAVDWALAGDVLKERRAMRISAKPGRDGIVPPAELVTPIHVFLPPARPAAKTAPDSRSHEIYYAPPPRKPRRPRQILNRAAILQEARGFAAGLISREEFLRRITVQP